jgi:acyl-coenzyme A thioesterase 9
MRRAFELAYSNAYVFGGSRPIFVELDEVSFTSPVDVGDLLVFNSCVLYTEDNFNMTNYFAKDNYVITGKDIMLPLLHIEVECWITEPEKASAKLSNLFCFTFAVSQLDVVPERRIRRVLPSNVDEARRIAKRISSDIEQRTL